MRILIATALLTMALVLPLAIAFVSARPPADDLSVGRSAAGNPGLMGGFNWKLIYPGTKYCGEGNISGAHIPLDKYLPEEDACCEAHDQCPNYIDAGKTNITIGLTNDCYLSQSHCDCEEAFFKCLKKIDSMHSRILGGIYFSGMMRKCFENNTILKCKPRLMFWKAPQPTTCGNCFNYCTDYIAKPAYHWRPTPMFHQSNSVKMVHPPC